MYWGSSLTSVQFWAIDWQLWAWEVTWKPGHVSVSTCSAERNMKNGEKMGGLPHLTDFSSVMLDESEISYLFTHSLILEKMYLSLKVMKVVICLSDSRDRQSTAKQLPPLRVSPISMLRDRNPLPLLRRRWEMVADLCLFFETKKKNL